MKLRYLLLTILAAGLVFTAPAASADSETLRNLNLNLTADDATSLDLEIPVGELHVEGTSGDTVQVRIAVQCNRPVKTRCEKAAQRIEAVSETRRDKLSVELDNWPRGDDGDGLSVEVRVEMPATLSLDADLGVGEFESVGLLADLTLDLGVGEATIRGREERVRRVDLEVGVGEANLRVRDRNYEGKGFIGRELEWSNDRGEAALRVDCGVGEVDVRLDD